MRHDDELNELINRWEMCLPIEVISMGGLSEGYEIAIWDAAFQILDKMILGISSDPETDWDEDGQAWASDLVFINTIGNDIADEAGLTGAQTGAAKNAAIVLFRHGHDGGLALAPDRVIVINKKAMINPFRNGSDQHREFALRTGIGNQSSIDPQTAPYQLKCPDWPGMAKVIEESGELGQVFGKIQSAGGATVYPWGNVDLKDKTVEEVADLLAALTFMVKKSPHINEAAVSERMAKKFKLFEAWADGRTDTTFEEIQI